MGGAGAKRWWPARESEGSIEVSSEKEVKVGEAGPVPAVPVEVEGVETRREGGGYVEAGTVIMMVRNIDDHYQSCSH